MKKITLLLLLFVSTAFYAQSTGISYQAIIYNPNGEVIPGYNNTNSPLANKNICLQFTIIDSASLTEYQEKITITTDEYGMVNTVIGTGIQTGGYATSFANVNWSLPSKRLKVGLDTFALCTNFIEISNQLFTSVPYAFAANSAENVTGVVPILHGGTSATTVLGAKTNLGLENVDNTRDINKPISIATQAALNLKEDLANKSTNVAADGTSNTKYPSVKAIKDYVDAGINAGGAGLANEAVIRANADLLKEDLVNKSTNVVTDGASNTKYPSVKAIKTYVDAADANLTTNLNAETAARIAGDNSLTTNLAAEIARATALDNTLTSNLSQELTRATSAENALTTNLAAEVTRATAAEATKENTANKSTATALGTSDVLFPTQKAVKTYVDAGVATATAAVTNEASVRAAADATLTTNLATEVTRATTAEATKENSANKSTVTALGTSDVLFPTQNAVKTYVDTQVASATIADADATTKGKIQLNGDLTGTAAVPVIANNAIITAKIADASVTDPKIVGVSGSKVIGNISGSAANVTGVVPVANGGTGSATQNFVDLTTAQTVAGAKTFSANVNAPSVTSPIYVSTPQALTSGATISWNPANGLNAAVTLTQNSTLSFSSTPVAGTYGTLVVTQDATGGRTLTLPSTTNVILGSSSTTTIGLSSAANAKDILNFYYDGTNCYWNIGQGYGIAAPAVITNLASGVTGSLPVANGGTGATTLTGIVKGNGTSALTAAVAGTDYQAPLTLTTTGSGAATLTGTTLNIPAVSATVNANTITGMVAIANGGTGSSTRTTAFDALSPMTSPGDLIYGGVAGTGTRLPRGVDGQVLVLTSGVPTWAPAPATGDSVQEVADEATATVGQVAFTLTRTPSIKSKVKMYINGIRITNTAYTISGTTVTYNPANNGSYALIAGDRIQFDYYF